MPLEKLRALIERDTGRGLPAEQPHTPERLAYFCPDCGAALAFVRTILPPSRVLLDTG